MQALEKDLESDLRRQINREPIYQTYLSLIRGIGPILGANIVGLLHDPRRFDNVSALWHYAGYHVENGCAPRRVKGTKITWNPRVRALGYKIGKSFILHGGGYEKLYREFKSRYLRERPELTRAHVDAMARRKTVKLFFAHLWHVWRTLESLPVKSPKPSLQGRGIIMPFIDTPTGPKIVEALTLSHRTTKDLAAINL